MAPSCPRTPSARTTSTLSSGNPEMAGVAKQTGRRQSNSHIVALLSLKILLLAFFILLNALATFEDNRRTAVVDSVRQAFQGLVPAQASLESSPAALDVFDGAEQVVDALHQLFASDLPIVERAENPGSWILRVDLPVGDLFAEDGQELLPEGAETLRLIAAVLDDPRFADSAYRVDVLHGLQGSKSGLDGHRGDLVRAGILIRGLERLGLSPARLSAGFLPDFAGRVRFHFTLEQVAPPQRAGGQK